MCFVMLWRDDPRPGEAAPACRDYLLELHAFGIDTAADGKLVDADVTVDGQFIKTVRFRDRRGDGGVDVGNVYVPIPPSAIHHPDSAIALRWVAGERWVQIEDVELRSPTGRGSQPVWNIGLHDGSNADFGDERLTDDSYVVGDNLKTFEQVLNVVDEPTTDISGYRPDGRPAPRLSPVTG